MCVGWYFFYVYSNTNKSFCKQTVETLTICLCPIKRDTRLIWVKISPDRLEKPGIELATPGLNKMSGLSTTPWQLLQKQTNNKDTIQTVQTDLRHCYFCIHNKQVFFICLSDPNVIFMLYLLYASLTHAREPLYSKSAVIAWWSQSTSGKNMHLAVEKGNKFLNISLLRVFFADYCQ